MLRRDFLKGAAAGGLLVACGGRAATPTTPAPAFSDPTLVESADLALQAARDAGATYADVRFTDTRWESLTTREARVMSLDDTESRGFGVRVIAAGTWGFAASNQVTRDEIARVARRAVELARANSVLQREPIELAPVPQVRDVWTTPIERDPFTVPIDEKIELLLKINATALAVPGVRFCSSWANFVREHKFFASTEGSYLEQTLHRCGPGFTVTSIDDKRGSFQTRNSLSDPQGKGYEFMANFPWLDEAKQAGEDAVRKHTARSVEPGKRDLILHPSHLWLTIHESIGHPTIDRALGLEANFAGTSFLTPDQLGKTRIGSDIVNVHGEKTHPGGLATCGYDDDGAPTVEFPLVERGIFVDYQTTREQAHWIGRPRGYATSYAQGWDNVAFQRMPNVNLVPGTKPLSLAQLIADTEDGILIKGRGSYSIDHQRYNFQFSGQTFQEIKDGKLGEVLVDVAYQARTPDFWQACDAICSAEEYQVNGSMFDGKGEPGQSNPVSHGCAPARFRQINVLNTKRSV